MGIIIIIFFVFISCLIGISLACITTRGAVFKDWFGVDVVKKVETIIPKESVTKTTYIEKKQGDIFLKDTIIISEKYIWCKSCDISDVLNKIKDIGRIISVNDTVESYRGRKIYGIDESDFRYEKEIRSVCVLVYELEKDVYAKLPKDNENNNKIKWGYVITL